MSDNQTLSGGEDQRPNGGIPGSNGGIVHAAGPGRPRTATTTAEIGRSIIHPGSVRINVKGAFIVDQESSTPASGNNNGRVSPTHHETKDIRLPYHTAVVSHIAIDVSPIR